MITAKQLLQHKKFSSTIVKSALVFDAVVQMDRDQVGALIVIEDKKLIGILSERDYTRKIVIKNRSSKVVTVGEIMTTNVITIQQNQSVNDCMKLMHESDVRHLPVMNGNDVVGLLSIKDVLGNLLTERDNMINQLVNYVNAQALPKNVHQ